jgi:integrase/recombinase XerD
MLDRRMIMNKTVSLTMRGADKKYRPVVEASANGRIKPNWVKVDGIDTHVPGGSYYLSYYEGTKCIRKSVGKDVTTAMTLKKKLEFELQAKAAGISVTPTFESQGPKSKRLDEAASEWLQEISEQRDEKTWLAYKVSVAYFLESCKRQNLDDVDRSDLMQFKVYLRDTKKLKPRSVSNRFTAAVGFLKAYDAAPTLKREDYPKYVKTEPTINQQADLDKFFSFCTEKEKLLFTFMIATGMRKGECVHVTWKDVDFEACSVSVRHKPEYKWSPKASKERIIQMPASLCEALREAKLTSTSPLLFPADNGRPDEHMLRKLKVCVLRAGMNPKDFTLQQMRRNYATKILRGGFNLRDLQSLMGHSSLAATARYLSAVTGKEAQSRLDTIFA